MGIGTGKTSTLLMVAKYLIADGYAGEILIIGPKKVVMHTWPSEIKKWQQTSDITYSIATGSDKDKRAALKKKADIYLINQENVSWLKGILHGGWPYKIVIVDEFHGFKNRDANRTQALIGARPLMHLIVGLTGTPAPNGLHDLWAPLKMLDKGVRLGKTIGEFRRNFLVPDKYNKGKITKYKVRSPDIKAYGADIYEKIIYERIGDICISMRTEDVVKLPPIIQSRIDVIFPDDMMQKYEQFERDAVLQYMDEEITAVNAGALCNKLIQFCNGAVYLRPKSQEYMELHNAKLEALEDILEDLNGSPLLCFTTYQSDVIRMKQYLKRYKPRVLDTNEDIDAWNRGEIQCATLHPASGGAGINLQFGGNNILWLNYPYSLAHKEQADGRIHRPGVDRGVFVNTLGIRGTIEDDIQKAVEAKKQGQQRLIEGVKARIDKWR